MSTEHVTKDYPYAASYAPYALRRDATIIAKFLAKVSAHRERLALYHMGTGDFPRPVGKDAKWPAYEAASRIARTLDVPVPRSVSDLAEVLGKALAAST